VDDPQKPTQTLEAVGHTPRNYPILWPRLLPGRAQIALGSSQGVSLVSLPDGELLNFWSLESEGEPNPSLHASPDGRFNRRDHHVSKGGICTAPVPPFTSSSSNLDCREISR
jgi:hypothetical protein